MYAKVYQYKFPSVSEAKIDASFCADTLGKKIVDFNFQGLNVMIGKDGDLSIIIKFEDIEALKRYETLSDRFISDLKKSLVFKENQYAGSYVYHYENEAPSNEIKISGAAVVSN